MIKYFKLPEEPYTNEDIENIINTYKAAKNVPLGDATSIIMAYIITVGIEWFEDMYPWLKLLED